MLFITEQCSDVMSPESNLPIESNTNPSTITNVIEDDNTPWSSNPEDEGVPTITITVSDDDAPVEEVSLIDAENVQFVSVRVISKDGSEVNYVLHNLKLTYYKLKYYKCLCMFLTIIHVFIFRKL